MPSGPCNDSGVAVTESSPSSQQVAPALGLRSASEIAGETLRTALAAAARIGQENGVDPVGDRLFEAGVTRTTHRARPISSNQPSPECSQS